MSDSDAGPSQAKKIKRSFTIDKKLEVIKYAKANSIHKANREFGISRSTIRPWIRDEADFLKMNKSSESKTSIMKRLPGAGRKLTCEQFDTDLAGEFEWSVLLKDLFRARSRKWLRY